MTQHQNVNMLDNCSEYRQKLIRMLEQLSNLWGSHLRTCVANHAFDLKVGATRVYLTHYRKFVKADPFQHVEIVGLLEQEIVKLATTEWATTTVFVSKNGGTLRFCIDYAFRTQKCDRHTPMSHGGLTLPVKWWTAVVLLDDITIFSKMLEGHITQVTQKLVLLQKAE